MGPYDQYGTYGQQGKWIRCHCGHSFYIRPKEVEGVFCQKCATAHRISGGAHVTGMQFPLTSGEVERFIEALHDDHILVEDF
jgi:hypothetical protein